MHPALVEEIIKVCRQRDKDGDCPTVEAPGRETLEFCVLELARERDKLRMNLKIARDPDDAEIEAGASHWDAPKR